MAVSCRDRTTRMVKPMSAPLSVIILSLAVHGQAAAQVSIRDGAIADWTRLKDTMMKISEAMPEDEFGYRATPPERSFGQQILHVAEANVVQMGRFGSKVVAPAVNMKATSKAEILKALADSFDFGTAALTEQTDGTMLEAAVNTRFDTFMGPSTKTRVVTHGGQCRR
jgi:hypothetical protein